MVAYAMFLIWLGCCVLVGWLAERKGRNAARWVGLTLAVTLSLCGVSEYRAAQEMFFLYAIDGRVLGRNPAATSSAELPILGAFLVLLVMAALPYCNRKRCPDCGENIHASALICRYCRHAFRQAAEFSPHEKGQ